MITEILEARQQQAHVRDLIVKALWAPEHDETELHALMTADVYATEVLRQALEKHDREQAINDAR